MVVNQSFLNTSSWFTISNLLYMRMCCLMCCAWDDLQQMIINFCHRLDTLDYSWMHSLLKFENCVMYMMFGIRMLVHVWNVFTEKNRKHQLNFVLHIFFGNLYVFVCDWCVQTSWNVKWNYLYLPRTVIPRTAPTLVLFRVLKGLG